MSEQTPAQKPESGDTPLSTHRWRDLWQLHVPLVLVLVVCVGATIIEVRRASEGVVRALAYSFEWPMIGVFAVWMWYRFRKEGNPAKSMAADWRSRIDRLNAEADAAELRKVKPQTPDTDLDAWTDYVEDLRRRDPPGGPPAPE